MVRSLALAGLLLVVAALPAAAQNRAAVCRFLPVKENFVDADYVPGVDANGKPVVPADVKAAAEEFVDVIRFPVTIDLAQQLNQALPQGIEMQAPVAMIEIHKNSRVVYNGQDLTSEIYALCGKEPFDIEAAVAEPQAIIPPQQPDAAVSPVEPAAPVAPVVPETTAAQQAEQEEIIWGQGY